MMLDTISCDGCLEAVGTDYGNVIDRIDLSQTVYLIDGEVFCLGCAESVVSDISRYAELEDTISYFDLGIG